MYLGNHRSLETKNREQIFIREVEIFFYGFGKETKKKLVCSLRLVDHCIIVIILIYKSFGLC